MSILHNRIHESVALSGLLALSISLNACWIANWFVERSEPVFNLLSISEKLGPVSGLYLCLAIVYVFTFWVGIAWFHGKDCSRFRDGIFWLFVASLIAFFVFTLPFLYEFKLIG
ncbi:MAG: hypothetical protein ABIH21_02205 [Patescibacteria group bacterium]